MIADNNGPEVKFVRLERCLKTRMGGDLRSSLCVELPKLIPMESAEDYCKTNFPSWTFAMASHDKETIQETEETENK